MLREITFRLILVECCTDIRRSMVYVWARRVEPGFTLCVSLNERIPFFRFQNAVLRETSATTPNEKQTVAIDRLLLRESCV